MYTNFEIKNLNIYNTNREQLEDMRCILFYNYVNITAKNRFIYYQKLYLPTYFTSIIINYGMH